MVKDEVAAQWPPPPWTADILDRAVAQYRSSLPSVANEALRELIAERWPAPVRLPKSPRPPPAPPPPDAPDVII
jgi:hypothetical protein